MIGKPAPAIQGTDLSGRPVDLAAWKGDVVLVVFWASWCVPSSAETAWLDKAYTDYQSRGFRIVGINLDPLQKDGPKLETIMPNIKRFLLEHNVRWPNLVNGTGAQDYARAYGVAEIPTNVLIGRDGNVVHLDLSRKNLETVVARGASGPDRSSDSRSRLTLLSRAALAHRLSGCGAGGGAAAGLAAWARDSYSDSMNMWNVSAMRGVSCARTSASAGLP